MFISREEKALILEVLEKLEQRTDMLIERVQSLEKEAYESMKKAALAPHGFRVDGTPRAKPGRKAK